VQRQRGRKIQPSDAGPLTSDVDLRGLDDSDGAHDGADFARDGAEGERPRRRRRAHVDRTREAVADGIGRLARVPAAAVVDAQLGTPRFRSATAARRHANCTRIV
jgi:hypothetical protein